MAEFTEYFADYLETHEMPVCLEAMPDDDNGVPFTERLGARNKFKEIGAETEELFEVIFQDRALECVNKYKWKIEGYLKERDEIYDKYVTLTDDTDVTENGSDEYETNEVGETESTGEHSQWYNPLDANGEHSDADGTNDTGRGKDTTAGDGVSTYERTRGSKRTHQEIFGFFKSMPEMVKLTNELEVIYEAALRSFDSLFMGVL